MSDYIVGHIRTYVPILVGLIVALLADVGFDLTSEEAATISAAIVAIASVLYYAAVRALATRIPWVGNLLGVNKAPDYSA